MTTRTFDIDTSHSHVAFSVRHLVIAKVRGEFTRWSGSIQLDEQDLTRSSVTVEIDAASIATREEKRDAHLRSADFLDVEHHPTLRFASKRVIAEGGKVTEVIGDLTIRGTTREVTLKVEDEGLVKDPWGGQRAAFSARTKVSRHDFGLTWNMLLEAGGVAVGETVEIQLDVEAIARAASAAA